MKTTSVPAMLATHRRNLTQPLSPDIANNGEKYQQLVKDTLQTIRHSAEGLRPAHDCVNLSKLPVCQAGPKPLDCFHPQLRRRAIRLGRGGGLSWVISSL